MKKTHIDNIDLVLINAPTPLGKSVARLGLLTIASYVRQYGFNVMVLDGEVNSIEKQISSINLNDKVVGISATTDSVLIADNLCSFVKELYPASCCILGGFHASALPEKTLEQSSFDMVVFGEGELTVLDILNNFQNGSALEGIPGTVIKKNGTIIKNVSRKLISNLDSLPFPAYDLIDIKKQFGGFRYEKIVNRKCLVFLVSRGCPYDCVFCSSKIMWERKLRWYSTDYIIKHIEYAVEKFNIDSIAFLDDELVNNKNKIKALAQSLIETGLSEKIKWECQALVKSVTEETLVMMKDAGCRLVRFGMESGSPKILNFLKKGAVKVEDCYKAIQLCNKVGISSFGSFLIGAPDENIDDIMQTIDFIENSGLSVAAVYIVVPYPGTELYDICRDNGYLSTDISWSDFKISGWGKDIKPVIRNRYFTQDNLRHIRNYIKINVLKPLYRGKPPSKLDHRKEIESILKGNLNRTRESIFTKKTDLIRRCLDRPDKIMPFVLKKATDTIENIWR